MCIFFGFCRSEFFNIVIIKYLTQNICKFFRFECNRQRECFIILSHTNIIEVISLNFSLKSAKIVQSNCRCYFSCTIGSVVEKYYRVIIFYSFAADNYRFDKFIVFAVFIRFFKTFYCTFCTVAFREQQCVISSLNPFPALISVHYPISADYTCNRG